MYGVARNLVGDEYRRRCRRAELQRQFNEDFTLRISTSDDLYTDVRDAVERLPQMHREVLIMTYWEGLAAREIAVALDVNTTAVRARMMRARRMLQAVLNALGDLVDEKVPTRE
ncbi:RNA polymerase sigma factor [Glutamicibacter sp. NPDC087344]|uniref:RNA polymerase sigma factor n=1 Tax=Glutamicibacter sp. NPDC087344 TaxID=3363994 RepID=UPI0037F7B9F0